LNNLKQQLQIHHPEDWYQIAQKDIVEKGGKSLIAQYNHSLIKGKL
jgi:hypothetical protein